MVFASSTAVHTRTPLGHDSDWSRSMSASPISGRITLRNSAGVSVTTASSQLGAGLIAWVAYHHVGDDVRVLDNFSFHH